LFSEEDLLADFTYLKNEKEEEVEIEIPQVKAPCF